MKTQKVLALFLSCLIFSQFSYAQVQTSAPVPVDEVRVARLVGLAKVWGAVKFFHPYLAHREIDWDKALVETLPKVNGAKTPEEYEAAVNQMLAVLGDQNTRAAIQRVEKRERAEEKISVPKKTANPDQKYIYTENGVVVIDAAQMGAAFAEDNSKLGRIIAGITQSLPNAKGIVIDARGRGKITDLEQEIFDIFIRQALTAIVDTNIVLGSKRYRMHNGYATQISGGSTSYSSAVVKSFPQVLQGQAKTKTPPLAFIVNEHSPSFAEILSGLQATNHAALIQAGERAPESSGNTLTINLPDNVNVRIRTSELVNPDGSVDLQPDTVVASDEAALKEAFRVVQDTKRSPRTTRTVPPFTMSLSLKDNPYADMQFPTVEYRWLGLFRFWNVINYFFPYKNLIPGSWETVLPKYIPKFEANKDAVEYQMTASEMVAEIHDSHGVIRNADLWLDKVGRFQPAVLLSYIEDKSVVRKVLDEQLPIKVGDEILTIDDEPVEKKREYHARFMAASTPQWSMWLVHSRLLRGPKDSVVKLRVRGTDNQVREVALSRSLSARDPKLMAGFERSTPIFQVLPSGFGYVDLDRLPAGDVDKMFDTIKDTPAVIFDMRGYPQGTAWSIAPRLTEKTNAVGALFSRPYLEAPDMGNSDYAASANYSFAQRIPERTGDVYRGKVVVLIDEGAISQAEHTCLFFESVTDVTFIGMPTAGANGDISFMVMPGNLAVMFSGHDVRHADGRQLQRIGIQPTIRVAPTIRGIMEGRDEILERAIKYLSPR